MKMDALIERQYVFSDLYPARTQIYEQIAQASRQARAKGTVCRNLPYGENPRQLLDLFPGDSGKPLLVFVHGGYWRSQDKDSYSFVASALRTYGISVAVVGYPLLPEVALGEIVESVSEAIRWLTGPGAGFLPPLQGIVVAGHSAGGHLAASLASDPVLGLIIDGCFVLSGLFDLYPLIHTTIGEAVGLSSQDAKRLSPLYAPPGRGWLLAAVGSEETSAFHAQMENYASHWATGGGPVQTFTVQGADHYSILLQMMSPDGPLLQALLARFGLKVEQAS